MRFEGTVNEKPVSQEAVAWIPVTERLPVGGFPVLVACGKNVLRAAHAGEFELSCDKWGETYNEMRAELDDANRILVAIEKELDDVDYIGPYVEGINKLKAELAEAREQSTSWQRNFIREAREAAVSETQLEDAQKEFAALREKLKVARKAFIQIDHQTEAMRVWDGMEWKYHPFQAKRIHDKATEALTKIQEK